jgi:AGZA family xanthine/uracil permease-like MFS transporter
MDRGETISDNRARKQECWHQRLDWNGWTLDLSDLDARSSGPTGPRRYRWATTGDVNAFFGLMLDNVAGFILMVGLLSGFGFPVDFAVSSMVPGTAIGVLIGDLAFFFLAFRLARQTGRDDVTAMPLGLDTPSTFGIVLFVLGPSFLQGQAMGLSDVAAATRTWHIGIWCIVLSGVLKLVSAPFAEWVRSIVPRAGLLGSLAAIALVLISFLPLMEILGHPLPGMLALVIVLTTLIARVPLPGRTPGTLGALIVAGGVFYLMCAIPESGYHFPTLQPTEWFPTAWTASLRFGWVSSLTDALPYLPIAMPFALATIVGGIDCTESAAAAGDRYDTRTVIGVEAVATVIAGISGGVIQTTPYIGHPAYKAMGGRAAYTLGTALLVGSAGLIGYFGFLNALIPAPAVYPILVFVGLEISAQSFLATPRRHYAAVAFACLPALAFLAMNLPGRVFGDPSLLAAGLNAETLQDAVLRENLKTMAMLSSGFILTSLLWAWMLAAVIDHQLRVAAAVLVLAGLLTLFGVIHSPLAGNRLFVPFGPASWGDAVLDTTNRRYVLEFAAGYAASAVLLFVWSLWPLAAQPRGRHDDQPGPSDS